MPKLVDHAARRRDVIGVVWRIIVDEGLEHATLRRVAERSGLAIGSIRHFFGTKGDLLTAAAEEMVDNLTERLEVHAAQVSTTSDRRALTEDLLGELLPLDERRYDEVSVWLTLLAAARTDPVFAPQARVLHEGTRSLVRRIVSSTRHAGDEVEVERLAALIDGLALDAVLQPDLLGREQVRAVLRRHLDGLATH